MQKLNYLIGLISIALISGQAVSQEKAVPIFEDGEAQIVDHPEQLSIDGHLLLLRVVPLVAAQGPRVCQTQRRWNSELGDHDRHTGVMEPELRQVARVRIASTIVHSISTSVLNSIFVSWICFALS